MTVQVIGTTVDVLGKTYQLKCPEHEVESLRKAAQFLEEKMQEVRERAHLLSADRIAVFTALNLAHRLMNVEEEKTGFVETFQTRLEELHTKIETYFAQSAQLELYSAE